MPEKPTCRNGNAYGGASYSRGGILLNVTVLSGNMVPFGFEEEQRNPDLARLKMRKLSRQPNASKNKLNSLSNGFNRSYREKLMIDERNKTLWLCLFKKSLLEKVLSGVKHVRLDMIARDKGAPDKGHTTLFSSSKVVHYFPNFRSYLGMEYEQPWNMGKILLEIPILSKPTTININHILTIINSRITLDFPKSSILIGFPIINHYKPW